MITKTSGPGICTETSSGVHREFWSDLTASSAVNSLTSSLEEVIQGTVHGICGAGTSNQLMHAPRPARWIRLKDVADWVYTLLVHCRPRIAPFSTSMAGSGGCVSGEAQPSERHRLNCELQAVSSLFRFINCRLHLLTTENRGTSTNNRLWKATGRIFTLISRTPPWILSG